MNECKYKPLARDVFEAREMSMHTVKVFLNDVLREILARLDAYKTSPHPVFILETHNQTPTTNVCPGSSIQIMRL